jgi:hypothetical protein
MTLGPIPFQPSPSQVGGKLTVTRLLSRGARSGRSHRSRNSTSGGVLHDSQGYRAGPLATSAARTSGTLASRRCGDVERMRERVTA